MGYTKIFQPIESDPEIFTSLMHALGVHHSFRFKDVLDYDEGGALGLIIVFPESSSGEKRKAEEDAVREHFIPDSVQFLKQTIDNSCGLVAILHCILNTVAVNSIVPDSILASARLSSRGIAAFLEQSEELERIYQAAANAGETEILDHVDYHYVALVACRDSIYEMDGERSSPRRIGDSPQVGSLTQTDATKGFITSLAGGSHDCSVYQLVKE